MGLPRPNFATAFRDKRSEKGNPKLVTAGARAVGQDDVREELLFECDLA
jgi:hypothetical protein